MGWTAGEDTTEQTAQHLWFENKEEAVRYAERNGFGYSIVEPNKDRSFSHSYADNFKYNPKRRKGK